jgi:EpsI family protein
VVAALWPTWLPLIRVWAESADYHYGPLVTLVAVAWLIQLAPRIEQHPQESVAKPALFLALSLCAWLVAFRANVEIGKQALALLSVWLAVATAVGFRAALSVSAPFIYMSLALPVWELFVPLLQWMCVAVTHAVLSVFGIPVRIAGTMVTIPEGSFIVQESCSGKRYLIVALATAGLIIALNSVPWRRALPYLLATTALALLANWIRVIVIVYAGHATHMTSYFVAREHISLGWAIFALLLAAVWMLGNRVRHDASHPAMVASAGRSARRTVRSAGVVTTLALLSATTVGILSAILISRQPGPDFPAPPPGAGSRWTPMSPSRQWQPRYSGARSEHHAAYRSDTGDRVETYAAAYGDQRPDAELIHYSNGPYPDTWTLLAAAETQRTPSLSVRTETVRTPEGQRWLIDYYYVVDGVAVTRDWEAQLLYGLRSWGRTAYAAVLAVATQCPSSCESADRALAAYWAASPATTSLHASGEL